MFRAGAVGFLKREYNVDESFFTDLLERDIARGAYRRTTPEIWSTRFLIDYGSRLGVTDSELPSKLQRYEDEFKKERTRKILLAILLVGVLAIMLYQKSQAP